MQARDESSQRSVIVVDDDPILRELMSEQLAVLGWRVHLAENGELGLDAIARLRPDLAVIDLNMPVLDGYGMLRYLRQTPATIDLPVIVCTSNDDRGAIEEAYRLGASHFETKPINWPKFLHHVQFVMRHGDTERALRAAKVEALAASRMKSAMFQVLSHELKTPLTALIGLTDILETTVRDRVQPAEAEQLDHIVGAAQRLNTIVNDVMILSKAVGARSGKDFAPATLSEVIDDSLVGFRRRAQAAGVTLLLRPLEDDASLSCDLPLMRQALARLIDNAVRHAPDGSTVEIWAQVRANGQIVFSVKDEGPGLSPQKLKECLQPFLQENAGYARPSEGLGLGLPIAKAIAEAHGGELVIQTTPGRGLLAALVLPPSRLISRHPSGGVADVA